MKQGPKNHLSLTAKTAEKRQQLPLRQRQSGNTLKKRCTRKIQNISSERFFVLKPHTIEYLRIFF